MHLMVFTCLELFQNISIISYIGISEQSFIKLIKQFLMDIYQCEPNDSDLKNVNMLCKTQGCGLS